jgi:autotransporter-associated beta strand protein
MTVAARRFSIAAAQVAFAIAVLAGAARPAFAQSGSWSTAAITGGSWGNSTNWQSGVIASGAGNTAAFSLDFTSGASVTLDGSRTIGTVTTTSANPWSIDPGSGGTLFAAGFSVTGAGTLTVTAPLAGIDFTKDGSGTLALSNTASVYTGAININAGTLALVGSGNYSPGSNAIYIASGATLDVSQLTGGLRFSGDPSVRMNVGNGDTVDGTGTVTGGLKVASGGTVYPGINGVGTLNVNGSGSFDPGSNWKVKLSTANPGPSNTSNAIDFTGSLTLSDGMNMPIDGSGLTFTFGQTYSYVIGNSSNFQLGAVSFQPSNFLPVGIASPSYFSLIQNGGNLVLQFSPVPEPTFVLTCVGAAAGAWMLWRRLRPEDRTTSPA